MFVELQSCRGYLVSDTGQVVSLVKGVWYEMSLKRDKKGYLNVGIVVNGRPRNKKVHRLVMEAFVGPSTLEVNHKNGVHADNNLSNLEYTTGAENVQHSWDIGLRENHRAFLQKRNGEKCAAAKLSNVQAAEILSLRGAGRTAADIAAQYGISKSQVSSIWRGKTWRTELKTQRITGGHKFSVDIIDKVLEYKGRASSVQTAKLFGMTSTYVRMLWKCPPVYYTKEKGATT